MNPFSESPAETIASLGESELIRRIQNWLGTASPPSPEGIGDDCAAIRLPGSNGQLLATADPVIYQKHFDDAVSPEQAAAKLAKRNLSDLAAKGARPLSAVVSLALPDNLRTDWLERFYRALAEASAQYAFPISGGDISDSGSPFLGAFMTLLGWNDTRLIERRKADEGSALYVTGQLGGSRRGKHFAFEPRLAEGRWLTLQPEPVAVMDLSDGLGKDLPSLIAPGCIGEVDTDRIPIAPDAALESQASGKPPLHHALNDGEDFELLFALKADSDPAAFEQRWAGRFNLPLTRIGRVLRSDASDKLPVRAIGSGSAILWQGYEHIRAP